MKKGVKIFIFSIIPIILLASLVVANVPINQLPAPASPGPIADMVKSVTSGSTGFLSSILGGDNIADTSVLKLLLLMLLVSILWYPAKLISRGNSVTGAIIAVVVSILGVNFIDTQMLNVILLPYGTLAIAASILVPLVLYTVFLESIDNKWIRKIGWAVAIFTFLALTWIRQDQIGKTGIFLYAGAALLSIAIFIFDGSLRAYFFKSALLGATQASLQSTISELSLEEQRLASLAQNAATDAQREDAKAQLLNLRKNKNLLFNLFKKKK